MLHIIYYILVDESRFRHIVAGITRGSLRVHCIRSKHLFIVSYNEVVIILFPRRGKYGRGGPIIPVIILIGALTSTIIISVEIQHTTGERRREIVRKREKEPAPGNFNPAPTVLSLRYV